MLGRTSALVTCLLALATGCGPDDKPRDSCRQKPTFLVTLEVEEGVFPEDTRVAFEYGGGLEVFELRTEPTPQVVFCEARPDRSSATGGEGGAPEPMPVTSIVCELWTGGSTDVAVTATGFQPIADYNLRTDRELCTVTETIMLEPALD